MITTTRRSYEMASAYEGNRSAAGVDLLERPRAYEEYNHAPITEDLSEAKERRKNLDKLLNYDRYSEQVETVSEVVDSVAVAAPAAFSDEDIRPTSTTMQFGDADLEQMYKEMNRASEQTSEGYKLNTKGKIVVAIYAVIVTLIFALIVVNTGVLTVLSRANEVKAGELAEKQAEFSALTSEIESISSNEYVLEVAQNELGMVKGN